MGDFTDPKCGLQGLTDVGATATKETSWLGTYFWKMKIYQITISVCKPLYLQGTKMCTVTLRRSNPIVTHSYGCKESTGVPAVVSSSLLFEF